METIPEHLQKLDWYAQHLAWLRKLGYTIAYDTGDAQPRRADLGGADLSDADLRRADLSGANLSDADLRRADLGGANLRIPVVPNIDAEILAAIDAGGELDMSAWHCGTAHCRAGWAIHLAGGDGYSLERVVGPSTAGALIYQASRPGKPIPDFYCGDDEAMDDLRKAGESNAGQ